MHNDTQLRHPINAGWNSIPKLCNTAVIDLENAQKDVGVQNIGLLCFMSTLIVPPALASLISCHIKAMPATGST